MKLTETLELLKSGQARDLMVKLYGEKKEAENTARYCHVAEKFREVYGDKDILLFSSPGRTEISGNHTDHNHGKVLAGSINLDCVAAAAKNDSSRVNIVSETFECPKKLISLRTATPTFVMPEEQRQLAAERLRAWREHHKEAQ